MDRADEPAESENPYVAPTIVGDDVTQRGKVQSYAWYFAVGAALGILASFTLFLGPARLVQDLVNAPGEWAIVIAVTLSIGVGVGWLARDRRPAINTKTQRWLRFLGGFAMGSSPKTWQDVLDWYLAAAGVTITVQLSFYRFLMTIVLAIVAAVALEMILRAIFVRRPPSDPSDTSSGAEESNDASRGEIR